MKCHTPTSFMNEKRVGLLVRGFAKKPEDVPSRVSMMAELVDKALASSVESKSFIKRIDLLIWANTSDYPNEADCGALAPALKEYFKSVKQVFVHEVTTGDLFCSLLNYGVALQLRAGCDYSVIASSEANDYWSSDVPEQMVKTACAGALAIGVAINELTLSVREGRIANTMAMWHNISLLSAGCFDLQARKPKDDKHAHYVKGADENGNPRFYHLGGVEEMIPLARLVDDHGKCIAVIESKDPNLQYTLPDQNVDPDEYNRNMAKFATKTERQIGHLVRIGRDLSHIKAGVMDNL